MRRTPVLVLLVLTLALPIPALAQSATPAASPVPASGDFAGLVDIGGRKLYLECHGDGQSHRRAGGGLPRVWPLLDGRLAPPGCAADDGPARGGRVHPRLYLRPPRHRRHHRRGSSSSAAATPSPSPGPPRRRWPSCTRCCRRPRSPAPMSWRPTRWGGFMARLYAATYPDEVSASSSSTPTPSGRRP